MKRLLLFSTLVLFFLSPLLSFSQTYKVDEKRTYYWYSNWEQQTAERFTYANGGNKVVSFF